MKDAEIVNNLMDTVRPIIEENERLHQEIERLKEENDKLTKD